MERRTFLGALSTAGVQLAARYRPMIDGPWREAFPALRQEINGHPLIYLDSAATTLRPQPVIDALVEFYSRSNANPGATLHTLARRASAAMEGARSTIANFVGARDPLELVFTRGTTEGLNLVAATWGRANVRGGDEILVGVGEHASNLLPWRMLAHERGATLVTFDVDADGRVMLNDLERRVNAKTRIVAFSHVSNVLGMVNPAKEMIERARGPNRIVVVDGAQSVPHFPVNVHELGCDFLAFSSHKMLGPMGVGALWGRRELLQSMPPYQLGSNMAHDIDLSSETYSEGALKFGAGTPNASGPVGFAAAVEFLQRAGHAAITAHEHEISRRMVERLAAIRGVRLLGTADPTARVSVFSFTVAGHAPADVLRVMDSAGIAIRAGDLASLPLLRRLGAKAAARASCYLYTSLQEVDKFCDVLAELPTRTHG
jgi:cysteine desulfurase / selenocysteine lyase